MTNILIAGNPNSGKTTIFNLLTGKNLKTGNWHGVTVECEDAKVQYKNKTYNFIDLPGLYSLKPYSLEERQASKIILNNSASLVLNVCQAENIERALNLTRELIDAKIKTAIIINLYGELKKGGGSFNVKAFERQTGVSVFLINKPLRKISNDLFSFIEKQLSLHSVTSFNNFKIEKVYKPPTLKLSVVEKLTLNNILALPIFFILTALVFYLTFARGMPGSWLQNLAAVIIKKINNCAFIYLSRLKISQILISLICDVLIGGAGMILTFVPQIAVLFLFVLFLEHSGYISRLAFMTDGLFAKIGLGGRSVFSMLMGFGCSSLAVLSTRNFENKQRQKRAVYALQFIPCSAKLPVVVMIAQMFFLAPNAILLAVYALGIILSIFFAGLVNYKTPQKVAEIIELPPLRLPNIFILFKSLINQIKQFIIKIGKVVVLFLVIMWLLSSFSLSLKYLGSSTDGSILAKIGELVKYIFYPIGIKMWQIPVAMLIGIVAKEAVAGALCLFFPLGLATVITAKSALALIVFFVNYTTCISAIAATSREIGGKSALKLALLQFAVALLLSYIVYCLYSLVERFSFLGVITTIILVTALILLIKNLPKKDTVHCGGCKNK